MITLENLLIQCYINIFKLLEGGLSRKKVCQTYYSHIFILDLAFLYQHDDNKQLTSINTKSIEIVKIITEI